MSVKLTIIGAGPGGYVAAIRAAQMGAQVTVVEAAEVGGTCLNWGCIPTKTIITSAEALEHVRRAAEFGIEVAGEVGYNLGKIRERKDKVVSIQVKGIRGLFKSWGVSLIEGRGSLLSPDVVRVVQSDGTTMDVKSDKVIIATGSRPARLRGFPFDGENVITSDDAVLLKRIPKSLLIVGAGVIGSEFAFIYRSFGAEVTMVEMLPRALSTEDEDMSDIIEREFKKSKIKLIANTGVEKVEKADDGMLTATLSNGQEAKAEMILVSIGRSLNSENLGLDAIRVAMGKRGEILVNERMETNVPGIYAIGDVTGKILLAHVASAQGLKAAANALGGSEKMDYGAVPAGIFTMPEIGSVGLREQEAKEKGIKYRVGRIPYRGLGKPHAMGEITGVVKIIADEATDKVLGVHLCGAHATDLVHEGALAITMGATAKQLGNMIHAHPTLAEGIMEAAEDVHKMAIHLQRTDK
ncbi:MAG TPA: dihydrolipoyl dehydrogenase [Nitrospirota bacterium]|nr:dihydrolipoyl dehydrogenase [Nitrospirota bacterium]